MVKKTQSLSDALQPDDGSAPAPQGFALSISPQAAAANTGITMQPTQSTAPKATLQQVFDAYVRNNSFDIHGVPYNNDTTKTLNALNLLYPARATLPDVMPPNYNGYAKPSTAYYQNHPDELLNKQMLGQGI